MSNTHKQVLDGYFWKFVDAGTPPQETPLFTGVYQGQSIATAIMDGFELSLLEAIEVIETARQEVLL